MHANAEVFDYQTERLFRYLQVGPSFPSCSLVSCGNQLSCTCPQLNVCSLYDNKCCLTMLQWAICLYFYLTHNGITMHGLLHTTYSIASVTWSMCMWQVFTAAVFSFAHGSNDVANSIGPFATIYGIYQNEGVSSSSKIPTWILVVGMDPQHLPEPTQRAQLCSLCMSFLCNFGHEHCSNIMCKHGVQPGAMRCFSACGWQIMSMCVNIATAMHSTILHY